VEDLDESYARFNHNMTKSAYTKKKLLKAIKHLNQQYCPYCHEPYEVQPDGDRIVPPIKGAEWYGVMPHYTNRIGTIMKIDKCRICGRTLNE